jgi:hypothetical protein
MLLHLKNIRKLFLQIFLFACNLDKHQTVYNTCGRNKRDSLIIGKFESLL